MSGDTHRIVQIDLDEKSVVSRSPQVDHERKVAIYDLLEDNSFRPLEIDHAGPYALRLSIQDNRLVFDVDDEGGSHLVKITLPISVMKRIVRDYFMICDSYFKAIKTMSPSQIEAIDMGRRGLHNEGAEILRTRLEDRVEMNLRTARRLFTLVCVLHIKA
ncbi:MAG TPA: hypothetical protein DC046_00760 [Rhodospirillaceae bacterium]|nr:hypothetical protein [Rhodospirillaceae bacterium]